MELWRDSHWLPVSCLFEDLRRHIPRCTARGGQHVELLLVHDSRQAEVSDEKIGVIFWSPEEQVLWFEVAVDDAVVVEVGDGGESGADEICGVALVIASFSADSIKELAA